jgi:hypothetical protein
MELRLDRLLRELRDRAEEILAAIDRDPLLLRRASGPLVLANAGKDLFTPQRPHHLYAKGIVYRRDPYRLVSLPLVKIYNVGERDVTVADLAGLAAEGARVRFLRKLDGTLVQAFRAEGRTWFTTRSMIEGDVPPPGGADAAGESLRDEFDYLVAVRRLAERRYPRLVEEPALLEGRTLTFEFLHPAARIVTHYGDREDLVLLAAFDHARPRYLPHAELLALAEARGLTAVDTLVPRGGSRPEQIEDLLGSLAGTDQEGSVLNFERGDEVVYRVKVKSPDYLRLTRQMALCTYDRTVELAGGAAGLHSWEEVEASLRAAGRAEVPEELLPYYREHYERFAAYLADCERLRQWADEAARRLEAELGGRAGRDPRAFRKAFAARAGGLPHAGLIFAALDGRLDLARVRAYAATPQEAARALRRC